ncbi:MAG TPA: SdpI family protein [candidate division Zixibacteria bacterium]|nr:SdpI family protein [candidate division Zixibacteria bacterium]
MRDRWIGLVLIIIMYMFGYWAFPQVRSSVPLHSNEQAQVDFEATPFEAIVFPPILASLLFLIMLVDRRSQVQNQHDQYIDNMAWLLVNLTIAIICVMYFAVLGRYFDWITEVRLAVIFSFGFACIVIGYYLPFTKREEWIGIRTPWTQQSDVVWQRTHEFARWTFIAGGILISIAAWFPKPDRRYLAMFGFLIAALLPTFYSYVIWRRTKKL